MTVKGSCHCGATQFTVAKRPASVTRCSCSFCSKRGALWAYQEAEDDFTLTTARDRVSTYQWGSYRIEHHHCAICGCGTWSRAPLWDQQAVRLKLASLATKAAAARALAYHAAELVEAGIPCPREVSMVKALSPEVLHEVVHGCLQLHGGTGFMRGTSIERMVRDARVLTIGGGATEVMLEEVAKRM